MANKKNLTLEEFVDYAAQKNDWTKASTKEFTDGFIATMKELLMTGESIRFTGFATFNTKWRGPHKARNVYKNEEVQLDGRMYPWCEFHRSFKKEVMDSAKQ